MSSIWASTPLRGCLWSSLPDLHVASLRIKDHILHSSVYFAIQLYQVEGERDCIGTGFCRLLWGSTLAGTTFLTLLSCTVSLFPCTPPLTLFAHLMLPSLSINVPSLNPYCTQGPWLKFVALSGEIPLQGHFQPVYHRLSMSAFYLL